MDYYGVMVYFACFSLHAFVLSQQVGAEKNPLPPRQLRARAISSHAIKLKWYDPERFKGQGTRFYSIRYSAVGDENSSKFIQTQERRARVSKLHPNTTYVLVVRSVVGKRGSPWSKSVTATTTIAVNSIVKKLKATPLSSKSIRVSWKLPILNNETVAYAILWAETEVEQSERTAVVTNSSSSFTFQNLRPHRMYSFRVRSMLSEGPGGSTEKVFARPFSDKPGKAPRTVSLQYSNNSYVLVSWRPPPIYQRNGVLLGYKIQYKRKGSRRGDLCTVITKEGDNQYVLTDIADGETYKVRVAATTINGTGPFSKWETVVIPRHNNSDTVERKYKKKYPSVSNDSPPRPEKVTAADVRGTVVTLNWTQPTPPKCCPIVAYRIITRNVNSSSISTGDMVTGPSSEARISFLQPDTVYGFTISAYSIAGESEPSEELLVQTLLAEPPEILNVYGSSVVEGSSTNLTCVVSAEPPPEVQWFGPNRTLAYSNRRITNELLHREPGIQVLSLHKSSRDVTSHLLIDNVTFQQSGAYTCVAKNSAGTVHMPVSLQVNVPPSIVDSEGATVKDGEAAQLICSAKGFPVPEIVWLREDTGMVFEEVSVGQTTVQPDSLYVTSLVKEDEKLRTSHLNFPSASLQRAGNYVCLAKSIAGSIESGVALQINVPLPTSVQNLRALALSPEKITVYWDIPFDYNYTINEYLVMCRDESNGNTTFLETQNRKLEITGLQPNNVYALSVRGSNSQGLGSSSQEVKVKTLSNEGLEPANVSAVSLNSSIIQLEWESPHDIDRMYILGYNIYYKRESDKQAEMLFIEGNRNKQFLIGLGRDETYYLRIATVTTWAYEASSQWIRIQKHPEELLPPVAPQGVTAETMLQSIRVTWMSSEEKHSKKAPLLGYRIVYGPTDDPSEINRMELGPTAVQFTIRGLSPSKKYIISIRAFNKFAASEPVYLRAETKALPPSTVVNVTAKALSATEIHVHWKPPERGSVTRYQIRYWRPGKRDKQSAWLTAPTTDYIAGSLKKFSNYRFEIIPYSEEVIGEGYVIFAETLPSVPDEPPSNVAMKTMNATHLLVTWDEPPRDSQNGEITSYMIVLKKKDGPRLAKFSVEGARRSYLFKNLEPGEAYTVRMAAENVNGTGPFTDWILATTTKIEMRQPESPQLLQLDKTPFTVHVRWSPPRDIGVPVMGYIVGHGRYIPEVYRTIVGPRERNFTIKELKADTEYIISVRAFNHIGESVPLFKVIKTDKAPEEIKLEVPINLKVIPLSSYAMAVSWLDPTTIRGPRSEVKDGRQFLIRFSSLAGEAYQYLNTTDSSLNVTGLKADTMYEFAVRSTLGEDQSGWSLPVVNTTLQTAPSSPENVTVMSMPGYSSALILNWTQPTFPNGKIQEYIVYYTSDPTLDTKLWITQSTDLLAAYISDILPYTPYYFRVQARNAVAYGPLSHPAVYSPSTDTRASPGNVQVSSLYGNTSTVIEVTWTEPPWPVGQATGYMIYYTSDQEQRNTEWTIQSERGLSGLILGLGHNTTIFVKVRARYGASLGPFSDVINYTTPIESYTHHAEQESSNFTNPDLNYTIGVQAFYLNGNSSEVEETLYTHLPQVTGNGAESTE